MSTWGQTVYFLETGISRSFCGIDKDHPNENKTQRRTSPSILCWLQQAVCHHPLGLAEAQAQPGVDRKAWVQSEEDLGVGSRWTRAVPMCPGQRAGLVFFRVALELDVGTNVRKLVITDRILGDGAEAACWLPGWSLLRL